MGGLPPTANEQNIATFFSNALAAVGGTTAGPGEGDLPSLTMSISSTPAPAAARLPPLPECAHLCLRVLSCCNGPDGLVTKCPSFRANIDRCVRGARL